MSVVGAKAAQLRRREQGVSNGRGAGKRQSRDIAWLNPSDDGGRLTGGLSSTPRLAKIAMMETFHFSFPATSRLSTNELCCFFLATGE